MDEMTRLTRHLQAYGIPFGVRQDSFGCMQVCYPSTDNIIADVICNPVSYGHKDGLLELMGLDRPDVTGYLTAEDAFILIRRFHTGK